MAATISYKGFSVLGSDDIFSIFSFLDYDELAVASAVSRMWHNVTTDNALWKNLQSHYRVFLVDDGSEVEAGVEKWSFYENTVRSYGGLMQKLRDWTVDEKGAESSCFICTFPRIKGSIVMGWGNPNIKDLNPENVTCYAYVGRSSDVRETRIANTVEGCYLDIFHSKKTIDKLTKEIREVRDLVIKNIRHRRQTTSLRHAGSAVRVTRVTRAAVVVVALVALAIAYCMRDV